MDKSFAAFMSYARFDDEHNSGQLTRFRKLLSGEVRAHIGMPFEIFQDTSDIALGQDWKLRICAGIDACALFMPIITPSFFTSAACRYELERFIARERELGRHDLILPLYYLTCPALEDSPGPTADPLVRLIAERNFFDLRDLRGRPPNQRLFQNRLTELALQVLNGLHRTRAKRRRGMSTQGALISGPHGSAEPLTIAGTPQATQSQDAALLDLWNQMRHYYAAGKTLQKDA